MRGVFATLLVLLLSLSAQAADNLAGFGFHQRPGEQVPLTAELRDEYGQPVRFGDLLHDQPAILVLGYYHCPNLCGVVRDDVFDALSRSGLKSSQYTLIAVSIDPAETSADAATAKRQDLARYPVPGAAQAWHYLTGSAAALAQVAKAVGFKDRYDVQLKQFLHPAGLVFLTSTGRVSGYLLGVGYTPGDLALGVTRARSGGFEKAAVPVLLLCFHFDPTTGRYTLAITKVLQLAGLITVLTIGGLIGLALSHERTQ